MPLHWSTDREQIVAAAIVVADIEQTLMFESGEVDD